MFTEPRWGGWGEGVGIDSSQDPSTRPISITAVQPTNHQHHTTPPPFRHSLHAVIPDERRKPNQINGSSTPVTGTVFDEQRFSNWNLANPCRFQLEFNEATLQAFNLNSPACFRKGQVDALLVKSVSFLTISWETNYLRIHLTDFHDSFHQMFDIWFWSLL